MADKINTAGPTIGDAVQLDGVIATDPKTRSDSASANSPVILARPVPLPSTIKPGSLRYCPACFTKNFNSEGICNKCGYDKHHYSVEGFKAFKKREAKKNAPPKPKTRRPAKAKAPRKRSGKPAPFRERIFETKKGQRVRVFKRKNLPLQADELQVMKAKADEAKMPALAARIARDVMNQVDKRIKREKWTFEAARYKFAISIAQEIKDVVI